MCGTKINNYLNYSTVSPCYLLTRFPVVQTRILIKAKRHFSYKNGQDIKKRNSLMLNQYLRENVEDLFKKSIYRKV